LYCLVTYSLFNNFYSFSCLPHLAITQLKYFILYFHTHQDKKTTQSLYKTWKDDLFYIPDYEPSETLIFFDFSGSQSIFMVLFYRLLCLIGHDTVSFSLQLVIAACLVRFWSQCVYSLQSA
jgi:hypothetical protein